MNDITNIRTHSAWMAALAIALTESDAGAISELRQLSTEWLQPEQERMAQFTLLDAAHEAITRVSADAAAPLPPVNVAPLLQVMKAVKDLIFAVSVQIMDHGRVEAGTPHSRALIDAAAMINDQLAKQQAAVWTPVSMQLKKELRGKLCVTSFKPMLRARRDLSLERAYVVGRGVETMGTREPDFVLELQPVPESAPAEVKA